MSRRDNVKEELLKTDREFRRLYQEHQAYERQLDLLRQKSVFSQDDEMEVKRIKVHKLQLKDRMEALIRSRSPTSLSA